MDEQTIKIILAVIALLTVIVSGSLIAIKKSTKRNTKSNQDNITITGIDNKVIGGDDNTIK